MKTIRTIIADDHAVVRTGLAALLEAEPDIVVVSEVEDGAEAVRSALRHKPDVATGIIGPGSPVTYHGGHKLCSACI